MTRAGDIGEPIREVDVPDRDPEPVPEEVPVPPVREPEKVPA